MKTAEGLQRPACILLAVLLAVLHVVSSENAQVMHVLLQNFGRSLKHPLLHA